MAAHKPPRAYAKSRSVSERLGDESVYALGQEPIVSVAPRIKTYNVAPAASQLGQAPPTPSGGGTSLPPTPKARTSHADSSQALSFLSYNLPKIESIFNPVRGLRDAQVRAGIKPVNHARANARAIKEQSQMNALRKASDTNCGSGAVTKLPPVRSTSAPAHRPLARTSSDGGRDFVLENKYGAAAPMRPGRPEKKEDDGAKYLAKRDYGRVPQYLLERKLEMVAAQDAKERAKEAALIPPGMRLLPEEERLETLEILKKNRDEVERAIQGLPLRIETPSAIRRKDELERRLKEIEDAFKIFSRPKVIVHL